MGEGSGGLVKYYCDMSKILQPPLPNTPLGDK